MNTDADCLVIGGGFFGCCLALFLRSVMRRVVLVEAGPRLLGEASAINQARIHTGFHYPRSGLTAVKSLVLHRRFLRDFPDTVVDDFQMLYAVARHRSRITARRFERMFAGMGAPFAPASAAQAALFDPTMVEHVFACDEFAFDADVLRRHLVNRLDALGVEVRLGCAVTALDERVDRVVARVSDGSEISASRAFNVTYAGVNRLLDKAGMPLAAVKHELAEVALVAMPPELERIGVTVMDGPFFSAMPYPPARGLHSLTHVRYTPQQSWIDRPGAVASAPPVPPETRHRHMLMDARRYVPALGEARWQRSLHTVKSVLLRNESDDGRPILFQRQPAGSRVVSVLGGKIDNIYDLFELMRRSDPVWAEADDRFVHARASVGA